VPARPLALVGGADRDEERRGRPEPDHPQDGGEPEASGGDAGAPGPGGDHVQTLQETLLFSSARETISIIRKMLRL